MSEGREKNRQPFRQRPWSWIFTGRPGLDQFDHDVAEWMHRWGHYVHRLPLGFLFLWFGMLKVFGQESATSLIARTVYFGDPAITVPMLGLWEAAIGVCLIYRPMLRVGLLLLFIRLPGTMLALVLQWEVCFHHVPFAPTVEGQYLIKDLILFGAAMVIGGTVRWEEKSEVRH